MRNVTLQTRFFLFSTLAAFSVIAMAGVANYTIRRLSAFTANSALASSLIRDHMQADMMHDDIRGDVLRGMLAHEEHDSAALQEARENLARHNTQIDANFDAELKLPLPDDLHNLIARTRAQIERYKQAAAAALADPGNMEFKNLSDAFESTFHTTEASQIELSAAIDAWATRVDARGSALADRTMPLLFAVSAIAVLLAAAIPFYARYRLFKPLRCVIGNMERLAKGEMDVNAALAMRGDEIGLIGQSLQVFKENAMERKRLEQAQKQAEIDTQAEKKQMMARLADGFETDVNEVIASFASAAADLNQVAETMQRSVGAVSQQSESVATISQRAASNVANVSAAVEEMSASVREIAGQVSKSSGLVSDTVGKTAQADKTTHMLSDAVGQISGILELIQDIAGQINLLALNATIESARAGEAGKGFAVVASEVKNLASQTTKATEEIARQIENVQHASHEVVEVLRSIQDGIGHVNQYSSGIASAVEEQSVATREISANMQHAALGVQDITGNMSGIAKVASDADKAAHNVLNAAQMMSRQSDLLRQQITRFLSGVRA